MQSVNNFEFAEMLENVTETVRVPEWTQVTVIMLTAQVIWLIHSL